MRLPVFALLVLLAVPLSAAAGTVTGRVVFRGQIPILPPISVPKDRHACGSEVPEQRTKKSVKVEIPRRSSATISSAFLSEASLAQLFASSSGSMGQFLCKVVRSG